MGPAARSIARVGTWAITGPRPRHPGILARRAFVATALRTTHNPEDPPRGNKAQTPSRPPPGPPTEEGKNIESDKGAASYLGTTKRLPEFNLNDRVVLVSGAAQGLGLTQTEALLEAGATVYALDRQPKPTPDFHRIQKRAADELGTTLHYRQIDVRDTKGLNDVVAKIAEDEGRMDGLIAAAGIQQELSALDYTPEDANRIFEINVTGVFMTSQAVAKQMVKFGNGGSIVLIASMSAHGANRVSLPPIPSSPFSKPLSLPLFSQGLTFRRV